MNIKLWFIFSDIEYSADLSSCQNTDYVCGGCGTQLSTPRNGVDNEVPQLPKT